MIYINQLTHIFAWLYYNINKLENEINKFKLCITLTHVIVTKIIRILKLNFIKLAISACSTTTCTAEAEMEVGSGFSGRVGPGSGRVSGLTFQREIGLSRAQSRAH